MKIVKGIKKHKDIPTSEKARVKDEIPEKLPAPAGFIIPPVERQYLKAVRQMTRAGNKFYFSDGVSKVELNVVSDAIIRIRMAPKGEFLNEFSYAISENKFHITRIDVSETREQFIIATDCVSCCISKVNLLISFLDKNDVVLNTDAQPIHFEENTQYGGYNVFCSKQYQKDEHFFGLGDKPMNLDLLGKRLQNWGTDAYDFKRGTDPLYKNIPFYIGIHHGVSYGIFFDNTYRTVFDFACQKNNRVIFSSEGGELLYYFIAGPQMINVVKRYTQLTGAHPLPPKWALGFHQSRWSYYPEKKLRVLAKTFREKKIPCDAIHFDIDYMDGFRCFTWNKRHFPDPKKMISDLHKKGFKSVAIIDPGIKVDENYRVFQEGKENNYFCQRADDYSMEGYVWPGLCRFPDFTNEKVREWWGGLFEEFIRQGILGIWNDMNEPAVFGTGTFPLDVNHHFDGFHGSHRKAHNIYGMQMARATYEGMKKLMKNKRPFTISRSGYAGLQRYSSTWTGDNRATWDHLKLAMLMIQRLSMSGISFCGSDIGGFTGKPDAELYIRWIQLGVFSPFMRVHSAGDTRAREPWTFGSGAEKIVRKFIELRYKLLPYFYSVFREHAHYHLPMIRPLCMIEQEVAPNFQRDDEFVYGDKILVAPVCEKGAKHRDVYLPGGLWYHYWEGHLVEGGKTHQVSAPRDSMPLFVKAGSVIPENPVMQFTAEIEISELTLNIFYSPYSVSSFLYEDSGDGFGYENEIYSEKKFQTHGGEDVFLIRQEIEGKYKPRYKNYRINLYGLPYPISKVKVDGRATKFRRGKTSRSILFKVNKNFRKIEVAFVS